MWTRSIDMLTYVQYIVIEEIIQTYRCLIFFYEKKYMKGTNRGYCANKINFLNIIMIDRNQMAFPANFLIMSYCQLPKRGNSGCVADIVHVFIQSLKIMLK